MNNTEQKVASNTAYQIIGKALTMAVTIIATLLVTRNYGRELYGQFSLMQGWPALFFIIVDFGFNAIATRDLSKDFSKVRSYLGNILILRMIMAFSLILLLLIGLLFFPYTHSLKLGIGLSLFLIITQSLFTTTNIIFQTKLRYDYSSISLIAGYIVILILVILFSVLGLPVMFISFSYVIGGVITFFVAFMYLKKMGITPDFTFDKNFANYLFIQTVPLGIMFIFSQINFKVDEILLSALKLPNTFGLNNNESVAIYSLPYKIFEVALVVPTFFMNSVYPIMVRHIVEGKEKIKKTFLKTISFLSLFAVISAMLGYIFAPFAIKILGGESFGQSVIVLRILLSGLIFYNLTQPISWLIVSLDRQKYLPLIYFIAAVFNFIANLLFIPKYSFYGSAVITHISEFIILILLLVAAKKSWNAYYA